MRKNTNKYEICGDVARIITAKNNIIIVDADDLENLKKYSWYVSSRGYACTRKQGKLMYLHRILMNPRNLQVDHMNRNKLDNRKCNLRVVTNQENHFNRPVNRNNKSGHTGVYFHKQCSKWCVQLRKGNRTIHGGTFDKLSLAIEARENLEVIYFTFEKH